MKEIKKALEEVVDHLDEGVIGEENDDGETVWDVDEKLFSSRNEYSCLSQTYVFYF